MLQKYWTVKMAQRRTGFFKNVFFWPSFFLSFDKGISFYGKGISLFLQRYFLTKVFLVKWKPQVTVHRRGDACQTDDQRDLETSPSAKSNPGQCKVSNLTEMALLTLEKVENLNDRCPVEDDRLVLGKERPLITGSEDHTVFIKVWRHLNSGTNWSLFSGTEFHPLFLLRGPLPPEQHSEGSSHLFLQLHRPGELALQHFSSWWVFIPHSMLMNMLP